ncbi:hypothetical protein [Streptomyces fagopyri]|uniref:hypothetical protein n=1 Tax=Streptomyces fagopyri TaxID=2662397 RepID=UPI00371865C2
MSSREERDALTFSPALYDHALRLLRECPGGVPPRRGFSLSRESEPEEDFLPEEAANAVREALHPLPNDSATLRRRFGQYGIHDRHTYLIQSAVADLPLPPEQREAARALGRQLTRTGTATPEVAAGLALLTRLGELEDVPYLRVLGLVRGFTRPAVDALDTLDRESAAVVWLATTIRRDALRPLISALWRGDDQAIHRELVVFLAEARFLSTTAARRIAEATRLSDLLDGHPRDTALIAGAGRLLVRMGCSRDNPTDLLAYRSALTLYRGVVRRIGLLPPTVGYHATLLSLALDLSSGPGMLLDWPPGLRATLLSSLGRLLDQPRWALPADSSELDADQRLRAGWIRRTGRRPFTRPATGGRLRIEVVATDPVDREPVETRILIDGRPVVPAFFARGSANTPEDLLADGHLGAGPEPREVQLAEAWCTEGCCGALYVTIRRDGDQVVWENWKRPWRMPGTRAPAPELPAFRFDAVSYDAEISRAVADHSWAWPARTVARLVKAGLVERPDLLSRWDARRGWIDSGFDDPDTVVVTFWYAPGLAAGKPDGDLLQFRWVVPDNGTAPETQAALVLLRLEGEDPKTYAEVCGGSRERAEQLGFPWPGSG